jgi:gamma-glutamyltranspeptidase/glutathione hydrolase
MALAFSDRAEYFGDPDFVKVPLPQLLSPQYLAQQWKSFQKDRATFPSGPGVFPPEPNHTTHYSVVDAKGNAVSMTVTVNDAYGSGFVPEGTGVVMNNEMDDFSVKPGTPNLFGLVGAQANSIHPGKRPLSSMSPTIVRDSKGEVRLVLGAAGGPTILTSVFQVLVDRLRFGMSIADAVAYPRIHEQAQPPELKLERFGFSADTQAILQRMGYTLNPFANLAKMHALERFENGRVWGIADPRGEGFAAGE